MAHNITWDAPRGLVDPANDKDACGVGFIGELNKVPTRSCVVNALEMLLRMTHRGACGCEVNSGEQLPVQISAGISGDTSKSEKSAPTFSRSRALKCPAACVHEACQCQASKQLFGVSACTSVRCSALGDLTSCYAKQAMVLAALWPFPMTFSREWCARTVACGCQPQRSTPLHSCSCQRSQSSTMLRRALSPSKHSPWQIYPIVMKTLNNYTGSDIDMAVLTYSRAHAC